MKKTKTQKGITLIALIITIVLLLILAVVAINSIKDDGLIGKANNSATKYNESVKNEQDILDTYLGYLENNMPSSTISKLKVGDVVNYTPDKGVASVTISSEESGNFKDLNGDNIRTADETEYENDQIITAYNGNKWVVLKNDGKNITLISQKALGSVTLGLNEGFKNGEKLLDDLCASLYNGTKAIEVRNLKVEDINDIIRGNRNYGDIETNWTYTDATGATKNVPAGVKNVADLMAVEQRESLVHNDNAGMGDARTYVPNYYNFDASSYSSNPAYQLIFNPEYEEELTEKKMFLSSVCTHVFFNNNEEVNFNIRYIRWKNDSYGYMGGTFLSNSGAAAIRSTHAYRPVVILKANTEFEPAAEANTWDIVE